MAIKDTIKKVAAKVVDVTSDAISAPARMKANSQIKESTRQFNDAKMVNDYKGKPDEGNYTDPLFRARVNVQNDRFDREQKAAKEMKKNAQSVAKKVNAKPSSNFGADYAAMRSSGNK